eukprot:2687-Eustigmatos_ZCMA.PRE.1
MQSGEQEPSRSRAGTPLPLDAASRIEELEGQVEAMRTIAQECDKARSEAEKGRVDAEAALAELRAVAAGG